MDPIKVTACMMLASLAVSDLRSRRLPNLWVACFAAAYVIDALFAGSARATLLAHAAAGALSLAAGALLFRLGWFGGGDVKLASAVFLWSGPTYAMPVLLIVSVCGSLLGSAMLALGIMARSTLPRAVTQRLAWFEPKRGVPYGVALAAGGVIAVLLQPTIIDRARLALIGPSLLHQIGFALFQPARLA